MAEITTHHIADQLSAALDPNRFHCVHFSAHDPVEGVTPGRVELCFLTLCSEAGLLSDLQLGLAANITPAIENIDGGFKVIYSYEKCESSVIAYLQYLGTFCILNEGMPHAQAMFALLDEVDPTRIRDVFRRAVLNRISDYYARVDERDIKWVKDMFGVSREIPPHSTYIRAGVVLKDLQIGLFYDEGRKVKLTHTLDHLFYTHGDGPYHFFVMGSFQGIEEYSERTGKFLDCWTLSEIDKDPFDLHASYRETYLRLDGFEFDAPPIIKDTLELVKWSESLERKSSLHFSTPTSRAEAHQRHLLIRFEENGVRYAHVYQISPNGYELVGSYCGKGAEVVKD